MVKKNISVNKSNVDKRVAQILSNYKLDELNQDISTYVEHILKAIVGLKFQKMLFLSKARVN